MQTKSLGASKALSAVFLSSWQPQAAKSDSDGLQCLDDLIIKWKNCKLFFPFLSYLSSPLYGTRWVSGSRGRSWFQSKAPLPIRPVWLTSADWQPECSMRLCLAQRCQDACRLWEFPVARSFSKPGNVCGIGRMESVQSLWSAGQLGVLQ